MLLALPLLQKLQMPSNVGSVTRAATQAIMIINAVAKSVQPPRYYHCALVMNRPDVGDLQVDVDEYCRRS